MPRVDLMEDRTLLSGILTVTNTDDSGPGSLRATIAAAANGDTIDFAKGLRGRTIRLTTGELLITTSLDIDGPGSGLLTVSGGGASRVFEADAGLVVTIGGLKIADGYAPDQGGGILNDGSNLTLSGDVLSRNVAFESATTGGAGGALYSLGGSLNIDGCQFTGNRAVGAGGPSASGTGLGGGIDIQGGSLTLDDSTLSGNQALGGDDSSDGMAGGGGLFTQVPTTINDCKITDNVARAGDDAVSNGAYGGGLDIEASTTAITGCRISGDKAVGGDGGSGAYIGDAEGGAINDYGTLTISGSTFDRDQALGGSGGNGGQGDTESFEDYAFGGAIACTEASSNITRTTFRDNEAVGGDNSSTAATDFAAVGGAEGGALYNELGSAGTVTDCTFARNEALGGHDDTGTGAVVLVGEGLGGAIVSGYGGNIYGADTLSVSNTTLDQNRAEGGNSDTGSDSVAGLVGTGAGAGIANYAGAATELQTSQLIGDQASGGYHDTASGTGTAFAGVGAGGGIWNGLANYNSSGYGQLNASVVTVNESKLRHDKAQRGEAGDIASVLGATTTVTNSTVSQAHADDLARLVRGI